MHHMPDTTTPQHVLTSARRRRSLNLLIVAAAVSLTVTAVLAHVANAQDTDRDCEDFDSQAAAQDFLRDDPSDPDGLDGPTGEGFTGIEGVACESLPAPMDTEPVAPANESAEPSQARGSTPSTAANTRADASVNDGIQAQRTPHTGGPPLALVAIVLTWGGAGLWLASSRLTRKS